MIYAVSSIPSSKEALLPVSSGASLTGATVSFAFTPTLPPLLSSMS